MECLPFNQWIVPEQSNKCLIAHTTWTSPSRDWYNEWHKVHLRLQSRQHIVLGMFRILTPVLYDLHSNLQQSRSYSPSTSWLVYTQISYISIFLRLLHINPQGHNYNIRCRLLETWKTGHVHMPLHEFMRQNMHYRKKRAETERQV